MIKKGFTIIEIMIVVAIIAILALISVAVYQQYIERARNSATQSLLQQLAMAEAATLVDADAGRSSVRPDFIFFSTSAEASEVKKLSDLGFRPDPQIGFAVLPLKSGNAGFVAFAAHRGAKSPMHVYDDVSFAGVRVYKPGHTFGADPPDELPIFFMTGDSVGTIASTETVKVDIATGLVISAGP